MTQRGIDPKLQKGWAHAIEKQELLRLRWFRINEDRMNEIANKAPKRVLPDELIREAEKQLVINFQNTEQHRIKKVKDPDPIDPGALKSHMKPVDPAVTTLIYTSPNNGRKNYLKERVKLTPDRRYYFPEVSSFVYGWKMWGQLQEIQKLGFGRQQIIKDTFYRRKGVDRDPEWYKEPAAYSPTVCNCLL